MSPQIDVLVLGDHPCAYLAAAMLREAGSLKVAHALIPSERWAERLVMINPCLFELHPLLGPLKRKLDLTSIYGLKFLADDPAVSNSQTTRTIGAYVASFKQIHSAMSRLSKPGQGNVYKPSQLQIISLDEKGARVAMDRTVVHARLLILAGQLPVDQGKMIGLSGSWDGQILHRYTYLKVKGTRLIDVGSKAIVPMSLDLGGTLNWAWALPGDGYVQLVVDQPSQSVGEHPPEGLLRRWAEVLTAHGVLSAEKLVISTDAAVSMDLPLGGALAQEGVANRTLLIGPAGGFYTACAEDIYPNCWSAVHAVEVARKALKEKHLQDALQPYRQRWGSTLGDYLRGPQQNLRFLLPLVYRNPTMAARLTEAILSGKSVVR